MGCVVGLVVSDGGLYSVLASWSDTVCGVSLPAFLGNLSRRVALRVNSPFLLPFHKDKHVAPDSDAR
ncbi:unnamed protein product [Pleuronectes platessa]|uniref:Uncharacterized protein n=1 Tax=Pleuronectes platessa TaxID=8262 RepID=A0A9N7Z0U5_PLEPL|nr:unnamed protein product [Pleuronectes platessa]